MGRKRLEAIKKEEKRLKSQLEKSPQGSIRFIKRAAGMQYYVRMDPKEKSGKYLRKNEKKKIREYLQKAYDSKILKLLKEEEKGLERCLKQLDEQREDDANGIRSKIRMAYSSLPETVKENIVPLDMTDEEYAKAWQEESFEGKEIPEDKEIFKTDRGEYVRSKSELTIANALNREGIPYRYECPLKLKSGTVIYPDFTILNRRKRKILYWEHRGMMDNPDYARGAVTRNKEYMKNNIYLGENMVITEETSVNPLSTLEIEQVIREYLV